jgi:hypothetical protein
LDKIYPLQRTIGPATDYDICRVLKTDGKKEAVIELLALILPASLKNKREGKQFIVLTFQAKANEGDSPIAKIQVDWDGIWEDHDTAMQRHLTIKDITEKPTFW